MAWKWCIIFSYLFTYLLQRALFTIFGRSQIPGKTGVIPWVRRSKMLRTFIFRLGKCIYAMHPQTNKGRACMHACCAWIYILAAVSVNSHPDQREFFREQITYLELLVEDLVRLKTLNTFLLNIIIGVAILKKVFPQFRSPRQQFMKLKMVGCAWIDRVWHGTRRHYEPNETNCKKTSKEGNRDERRRRRPTTENIKAAAAATVVVIYEEVA